MNRGSGWNMGISIKAWQSGPASQNRVAQRRPVPPRGLFCRQPLEDAGGLMSKPYGPWVAAAAAATLLASFHSLPVSAETIVVGDPVQVGQTEVPHPRRGVSMAQVEKRFGEPRERHPAVGTPPITRWDYEHFAVFFEKDLVIDAVVPGSTAGSPDAAPIPTAAPAAV